jgi:hypothetical protein
MIANPMTATKIIILVMIAMLLTFLSLEKCDILCVVGFYFIEIADFLAMKPFVFLQNAELIINKEYFVINSFLFSCVIHKYYSFPLMYILYHTFFCLSIP